MSSTFQFLQAVLPETGHPVIAYWFLTDDQKIRWVNVPFDSIENAASYARWLDSRGREVYFACATYDEKSPYLNPKGKPRAQRTGERAQAVQALWADIDIKSKPGHHQSRKQAMLALGRTCDQMAIPAPTIVSSGRGIHAYWIFEEPIAVDRWKRLARAFKKACEDHDLRVDPQRATDVASVLRPVGCHWRKEDPARAVKLVYLQPEENRLPADVYEQKLAFWMESEMSSRFVGREITNDLGAGVYAPADVDADTVADECQQLGLFRSTQGNLEEPLWYTCLGVLNHATDGHEKAQEWSAGHPGYDYAATERKLAQWQGKGPALCTSLEDKNPGGCEGCPHKGKVKTPLQLGKTGAVRAEDPAETVEPWNLLSGYFWDKTESQMMALRRNDEGEPVPLPFCKSRYWVHNYILQDGEATLVIHAMHDRFGRENEIEEHTIKAAIIGAGGRELKSRLASIMLTDSSGQRSLAQSYLDSYTQYLKKNVREIETHRQFGWQPDGNFLLGDKLITPTEEHDVRLGGEAAKKAGLYDTSKPPELWTDVIGRVYNRPQGEPYQFVICSSLGSALVPLLGLEEFSGIPIAVTSDDSGYGKTTVCWAALAIWGAVRRTFNVLSGDEASLLSIEWQASIFNNIPTLLDEQTNRDGVFTSNMLYMLSNGTARARGKQDGTLRDVAPGWKGFHYVTGNRNILHKLTENKANPEAAQMRCFEISLDSYPKIDTLRSAQEYAFELNSIRNGYGSIALAAIRYIMQHKARLIVDLMKMPRELFSGMNHDKERFYVNTACCTLMGGRILRELGYVDFDMDRLATWSREHILSLRGSVDELRRSTEDLLSQYLAIIAPNILVTQTYGGTRNELSLTGAVSRDIKGRLAHTDGRLFVSVNSLSDWCQANGIQWHTFRRKLAEEGFCAPSMRRDDGEWHSSIRVNLGLGVSNVATGHSRVIEIDYARVAGRAITVHNEKVIPLRSL